MTPRHPDPEWATLVNQLVEALETAAFRLTVHHDRSRTPARPWCTRCGGDIEDASRHNEWLCEVAAAVVAARKAVPAPEPAAPLATTLRLVPVESEP
jgi:hypothetical protein